MMDQQKAFSLLSRQLTDILSQAERIFNGNDSATEIESFARYSSELKKYINERIENDEFKKTANEIPDINYKRNKVQFWQYLIFPTWWIAVFKDLKARQDTKDEIRLLCNKYTSLRIMAQDHLN